MKKMKKWLALGLAAVMALSMTACGGSGDAGADGGAAESSAANSSASGKTKITMAVWNGSWGEDLQVIQEDFNSKNSDIELDIQMQTGDYSDFLGAKVASNDLPDIYLLTPYQQVVAFAEAGRLMDLSDEPFVDVVYSSALDAVKGADGKIYAFPHANEYLGVFYNKDIFANAGIDKLPTTRDEFADVCAKLEAAGVQPIAPTYKDSWTLKHLFSTLITPLVQDDIPGFLDSLNSGKGTFAVDGIDEAFAFLDIMKQYSGNNMMDQDSTSGFNALANGQAAMLLSGEFSLSTVAHADPVQDIGCFAMPVTNDASKNKLAADVATCYAINANTAYPDLCKRVLAYMSDPEEKWITQLTMDLGDAPPAMPYSGGAPSSAMDDYTKYCDEGNTLPWVYQQYANGFDVTSGDILQGYMAGAKDQATVIQELDASYLNFIQ